MDNISDPKRLEESLRQATLKHDIFRIKGFINISGRDMRNVIQGVGSRINRYYDRPWGPNEDRRTSIVIIGKSGMDQKVICDVLLSV